MRGIKETVALLSVLLVTLFSTGWVSAQVVKATVTAHGMI